MLKLTNNQLLAELTEITNNRDELNGLLLIIVQELAERGIVVNDVTCSDDASRVFALSNVTDNPIFTNRNHHSGRNEDQWSGFSISPPNGSPDRCLKTGLRRFRGFFK